MLWSGALIRAHCHPDQQHESLIDQRTFYSRELLPELTQSLRGQHTFCDRKLLSELIDSPIDQKLLAIRSSYQSLLTPLIDQKTCCDRELLSELIVTPINKSIKSLVNRQNLFALFLDSLIDRQTSRDQELLSELNDSQSIKNVLRLGAHIWAHWLLDRPTNMSWSGALIRAHCQPDRQTLKLWLTNKLFTVESSYQSSLSPWEDNNIVFRSEALIRAHWLPKRPTNMLWSGALIRAHWLPDRPTNMLWSGALIRAHWHPDRQDDQGSLTPWLSKNFLRSGALTRAHWLPWSTKNNCFDRELLSELIVTPINKSIKSLVNRQNLFALFLDSLIDRQTSRDQELLSELNDSQSIKNVLRSGALIRAHWLPDRPTNMLWSGALIRAHWHPDRQDDQGSLTPWSIKNFLRSGALIRARWFPDHPTNFLLLGALIRAYSLPDWSESPCDQELVLELSDSRIDQQFSSDREL